MTVYEMAGFKKLKKRLKKSVKKVSKTQIGKIAVMSSPIGAVKLARDIKSKGLKSALQSNVMSNVSTLRKLSSNPLVRAGVGIIPGGGTVLTAIDTANQGISTYQKAKQGVNSARSLKKMVTPSELAKSNKSIFDQTKSIYQNKVNALKLENDALRIAVNRGILNE